jgi:hypothetical protein
MDIRWYTLIKLGLFGRGSFVKTPNLFILLFKLNKFILYCNVLLSYFISFSLYSLNPIIRTYFWIEDSTVLLGKSVFVLHHFKPTSVVMTWPPGRINGRLLKVSFVIELLTCQWRILCIFPSELILSVRNIKALDSFHHVVVNWVVNGPKWFRLRRQPLPYRNVLVIIFRLFLFIV